VERGLPTPVVCLRPTFFIKGQQHWMLSVKHCWTTR